jgi:Sec-independent protein translocase protein TatA
MSRDGIYALNDLHINNIRIQLVAKAALNYCNKLEYGKCCIQYQLKDLDIANLPVETSGEAREAGKLLHNIRKMITDKSEELIQSRIELEAKAAKLEKLQSTPPETFSSSEEKSKLTVELDQIIFDLNKTSEGQRENYVSGEMPNLKNYFPELSNTGIFREIEIIEANDEEEDMAQSA